MLLPVPGCRALLGPFMLNHVARARAAVPGNRRQSPELAEDQVMRAYPEPVIGSRKAACQFQCWSPSLRDRDLLAVEPDLTRLTASALVGGVRSATAAAHSSRPISARRAHPGGMAARRTVPRMRYTPARTDRLGHLLARP